MTNAIYNLVLEVASEKHRVAALDFKQEFFVAGERVINGSALLDQMDFDEWLVNCQRNSRPETARADWSVSTAFLAIRPADGRIVGCLELRHSLATDYMKQYAGHIGYAVRPSERQKGYASQMMSLALERCRELGISPVRIGCYTSNEASIRTIQANGGVVVEEKPYLDGIPMYVFEIDVDS